MRTIRCIINNVALLPIRVYKFIISPLFPPTCRHTPTCSSYAEEAINEWGAVKGVWLATKRILKCNPWGTSGYDPVPKNTNKKIMD